jgi:hypothetical protein
MRKEFGLCRDRYDSQLGLNFRRNLGFGVDLPLSLKAARGGRQVQDYIG